MIRTRAATAALAAAMVLMVGSPEFAGQADEALPVHVTAIAPRSLERHLTAYGKIVPEPARPDHAAASASLAATTGGLVAAVRVVEGQTIRAGAVAVQLDSRQADAALERSRAALTQATSEAERQRRLSEHDDTSAKQRERAERDLAEARAALAEAQAARDYLDVRASLSGTVVRVDVRPGEVVRPGDVLVEIVDLERLVAEVDVPAASLSSVRVSQPAAVQAAGREVDGRVVYVSSRVDPAAGTAVARIALPSGRAVHPGDFVRARIVVESRPDALAVPSSAVIYGEEGTGTVAVLEDGRVHLRPVRLGIEDGDWVEIAGDGIRAGVRIVTREAYGLPDGAPVRPVEEQASR